jgi:hypothetical protein
VFNQPEVALGILPGGSGTVRLSRLLGRSRALEVVLGCDDVDADLAEDWGWVNRTLGADALWPHVDRLAARIASFPPHAVAAAKASVLRAEQGVVADLQAEAAAFQGTLSGRARATRCSASWPAAGRHRRANGEAAAEHLRRALVRRAARRARRALGRHPGWRTDQDRAGRQQGPSLHRSLRARTAGRRGSGGGWGG